MKKVLLVSHYTGTPGGPVDKLYEFLKRENTVYTIRHPLWLNSNLPSIISDGQRKTAFRIYSPIQYPLEGFITLFFWNRFFGRPNNIDLAICFDSLSFIHIFMLKFLFHVNKIVFYNIDYSRKRFRNRVMNFIYQKISLFSYKKCDYFFSLYDTFIKEVDPKGICAYKNYLVKTTVNTHSINIRLKKYKNSLIYAGVLDYGSVDFRPLLAALKKLKQEGSKFRFDIYGKTEPKSELRKDIARLKLEKFVFLKGVVENKILIEKILPQYKVGICPYVTKRNSFTPDHVFLGSDLTAKLVDYIAAGLPIITTRINDAFDMIEENKFGFLVGTTEDWYKKIKELFTSQAIYNLYRNNALKSAKNYDERKVLGPIFKKIL